MAHRLLKLKTLTPIWTGGVTVGKADRLHETGIIGSMRWWYEALMRGLGRDVCNPTADNPLDRCPRDATNQEYCDVCRIFGATGWQRRFRVSFADSVVQPLWNTGQLLNIRPRNRKRGWYLPPGYIGELSMHLMGKPSDLQPIATLLLLLEQWGGLGAKQPSGYGRFALHDTDRDWLKGLASDFVLSHRETSRTPRSDALPDFQDFLFYRVQFQTKDIHWWKLIDGIYQLRSEKQSLDTQVQTGQGMIPVSPVVKNVLRFGNQWASPQSERWLFGTLRANYRQQSKVCIGWAIQQDTHSWYIPGWIWLPQDVQVKREYASIKQQIQRLIQDHSTWQQALGLQGKLRAAMQIMLKPGAEVLNDYGKQEEEHRP
jgi:CRISPR-associated protein Cmr1